MAMSNKVPILFVPVEASAAEIAAHRKIQLYGADAELTLREFAAYRGQSLESVRKNLGRARCVRRLSQKDTTIHLGTWHEEQSRSRASGI